MKIVGYVFSAIIVGFLIRYDWHIAIYLIIGFLVGAGVMFDTVEGDK